MLSERWWRCFTPAARVDREGIGGEKVLPAEVPGGVFIFAFQGIGQVYRAIAVLQVLLVQDFNGFDLQLQGSFDGEGQDSDTVFMSLGIVDGDLVVVKIDIFNAQVKDIPAVAVPRRRGVRPSVYIFPRGG